MMMQTVVISALALVLLPSAFGEGSVSPVSGRACPEVCTRLYDPQCVTLTAQFGNHCSMNSAQCPVNNEGLAVSSAQNGSCPSISDSKRRDAGLIGSLIDQAATKRQANSECEVVICTMQYDPVCVTYTKTFSSPCMMDAAICRLETATNTLFDVTSQSRGEC